MINRPSRRAVLRSVALAGASGSLAGCSRLPGFGRPQEGEPIPDGPTVALEPVAEGLTAPLGFEVANEDRDRRFVVDQIGLVRVHGPDGLRDEPFLDLRDAITGFGEQGLLGAAFHPAFADNGRLFVRYSAEPREGTPSGYSHTFVLSEFRAGDDRERIDPDSERTVMEIPQPQGNHNAGAVAFGPDGYLYVATGDGGAANDTGRGHVDDWYDENAGGNGQDVTENLLGGILRIDVDGDADPYAVPDDNPLVGEEGLDEYYAWGLRNPWRISFDSEGRLFVADAGQELFEEVNLVEKGGNYGWNVKEGSRCFSPDSPTDPPDDCPDATPEDVRGGEPLVDPVIEYPQRADGESVGSSTVGGYLAETGAVPALEGRFVFGDFSASFGNPSGTLFAATPPEDGEGQWAVERLVPVSGSLDRYLLSLGRDADGRLYALTSLELAPEGETGVVFRIEPAEEGEDGDGTRTQGDDATDENATDGDDDTGESASTGQSGFSVPGAAAGLLAVMRWVTSGEKR
ncbi:MULTISPECIES: sorbosone dehydrogenase family protein [Halostella]|uniref:PQQ-dependent sugar dehydrogenase n=1 Tax=Halostella TaxID=1843185 RepID=UPI001F2395AD|nr:MULTISPECIES: PQQ-dependent sugar dehydrogenase [Halostella]